MNKLKPFIILNSCLILFVAVLLFTNRIDNLRKYDITTTLNGDERTTIYGENIVEQEFICNAIDNAFEICAKPVNGSYHGYFDVSLMDGSREVIQKWHINKLDMASKEWIEFKLSNNTLVPGNSYTIRIEAPELDETNAIYIYMSQVLGEGQNMIAYRVYRSIFNIFCAGALIVLFICANLCILLSNKGIDYFAVPFLLAMGIIMLLVMAPASGMDEDYHYYSAFELSNIIMGRQNAGLIENKYRFQFDDQKDHNANSSYMKVVEGIRYRTAGEDGYFEYDGHKDALKQPLSHLAQSIGLTIGRLLRMNFIQVYSYARICNMLLYILLVYTAIRIVPVNGELMLLFASMPMAMHQAAQLSYDALINGSIMVLVAYILKCVDKSVYFTWKNAICCALIVGLVAPVKIVYVLLAFLVFVIPKERFKSTGDRILKSGAVLLGVLFFLMLTNGYRIIGTATNTKGDARFADETYTIGFVLQYPLRYLKLILDSLNETLWNHIKVAVGYMFSGDETLKVPEYFAIIYMLIMLLCAVSENRIVINKWWQRTIVLLVSAMGIVSVYVAFSFACTNYATSPVKGIHGRYFIPFLIPVMYCIGNDHIKIDIDRKKLLIPVCFLYAGYIVNIMSMVNVSL